MLTRHILKHGLVHAHLAHGERDAEAAQGHEHERHEERREGDGHEVQREVDEGSKRRAHHEPHVALGGRQRGEVTLPEHEQARAPDAQEHAARGHEHEHGLENVHGADEARRPGEHEDGAQRHQHAPRPVRETVRPHGTCHERAPERERLSEEERERDLRRLELHRQKREHAAPDGRGVHREEARVPPTGHMRMRGAFCHVKSALPCLDLLALRIHYSMKQRRATCAPCRPPGEWGDTAPL